MRQISRDPFGRYDVIRETVPMPETPMFQAIHKCAWCGGLSKRGLLYRYGIWHDAGRKDWQSKTFCSISCMRYFYGE